MEKINDGIVLLKNIEKDETYQKSNAQLPVILGKTNSNETMVVDLVDLPHLLVSGASKQGKTNFLKALITGLILKKKPYELKFVLLDTKYTAFNEFRTVSNQYMRFWQEDGVVNEDNCIANDLVSCTAVLGAIVIELKKRRNLLKKAGVKSVAEYNDKLSKLDEGNPLPYIVCVCDEYSDLTNFSGKSNKKNMKYILQMAKKGPAVGIHIVIATQRPASNVITWRIKRHFHSRIAFRVACKKDSKVILGKAGAEEIRTQGEMIFCNGCYYERIQTPYYDESVLPKKISLQ